MPYRKKGGHYWLICNIIHSHAVFLHGLYLCDISATWRAILARALMSVHSYALLIIFGLDCQFQLMANK